MLYDSKRAICNVPSLCIHLDRKSEFDPNKETHLKPILATAVVDQLVGETMKENEDKGVYNCHQQNYVTFLTTIADELGVGVEQVVDFELSFYDMHRPAITGLHNEFVSSPRLDNLCSSVCALDALITHKENNPDNDEVSCIFLFDHEECGSTSA